MQSPYQEGYENLTDELIETYKGWGMKINIEIQTDMKIPKILIGKMVLFQFKDTELNAIIFITDISDAIYGFLVALDNPIFPVLYKELGRLPIISEPIKCYKRIRIKELPLYIDYRFKFDLFDKFLKG
jgi:hypothetical protein